MVYKTWIRQNISPTQKGSAEHDTERGTKNPGTFQVCTVYLLRTIFNHITITGIHFRGPILGYRDTGYFGKK